MNQEWSAKNLGLQRQIAGGSFSRRDAMQGISERACRVANAAGAAIALVKSHELVYEAGSGTARGCVGRRVMATMITSASDQAVTEILRVEDAETDSRIQSAICRQFGARSLLILPISSDGTLSGLLQISFDQPHEFLDAEVEAYRALAQIAGQAMTAPLTRGGTEIDLRANPSGQALISETTPVRLSGARRVLWSRAGTLSKLSHACDVAIAAIILVASVGLVLVPQRASISSRVSAAPAPIGPVTQSAPAPDLPASQSSLDRLENATNPTPLHRRHDTSHPMYEVRYFGDDVTVRNFAPKTAIVRTRDEIEVRRVSDDVTVRYFRATTAQR